MVKWINRITLITALSATLMPVGAANAETYPSRPIEFVTQSSVGGGGDVLARQLGEVARDLVNQPMVVVNKPGAGGRNLENYLKTAKPDGHTLVVTTSTSVLWYYTGSLSMNVNTDLKPIIRLQVEPNLVVVKADASWKSMQELIAAAKADKVTFGGLPVGGAEHIFFSKLAKDNGYKLSFVAYGGGGEAITALLGGSIQATMLQYSEAADHVKAGTIRILGVASPERVADVEELRSIPTLREQGVDFVLEHWRGVHTLAGVPDNVVEYLHDKFQKATEKESWRQWLKESGQVRGNLDPVAFKAFTVEQDQMVNQLSAEFGVNKRK